MPYPSIHISFLYPDTVVAAMRLLRLDESGGLTWSEYNSNSIPPYAILSHTWDNDEFVGSEGVVRSRNRVSSSDFLSRLLAGYLYTYEDLIS